VTDRKPDAEGLVASERQPLQKPAGSRFPPGSAAYSRFLPALILGLAILMGVLILVAAGVLLGWVPYR
jgi:hypothetical protein